MLPVISETQTLSGYVLYSTRRQSVANYFIGAKLRRAANSVGNVGLTAHTQVPLTQVPLSVASATQ